MATKPLALKKMAEHDSKALALYKRAVNQGVPMRKPGPHVKFSASVHGQTLADFRDLSTKLDYNIQDALTEALDLWVERRSKK